MSDYGKVVGKFVAPVAQAGVYGESCQGRVDFVPRMALARTQEVVVLPAVVSCPLGPTGELSWKEEIGVYLRAPATTPGVSWTWEVHPHISYQGQSLWVDPFGIDVKADATLNLATATQSPVLSDGEWAAQYSTITDHGDGTATITLEAR